MPARGSASHRRCPDPRARRCAASRSPRPCGRRAGDPARARPAACPGSCSKNSSNAASASRPRPSGASASPELLVRERQSRLELDGPLEARHRLLEALLQREHAAEILVQVREVRLQRRSRAARSAPPPRSAPACERVAEQSQVIDAARAAARGTRGRSASARERPVRPQCLERGRDAVSLSPWRDAISGTCRTIACTRSQVVLARIPRSSRRGACPDRRRARCRCRAGRSDW